MVPLFRWRKLIQKQSKGDSLQKDDCRQPSGQTVGNQREQPFTMHPAIRKDELALMRRMDELHLEYPFAGSRQLRDTLAVRMCMH